MSLNRACRAMVVLTAMIVLFSSSQAANAQSWREKLRNRTQEAKRKWDDSARRCRECGKKIHGRDICASCLAKHAAEKTMAVKDKAADAWRDSADKREQLKQKTSEGSRAVGEKWRDSADERRQIAERLRHGVEQTKSFTQQLQAEFRERQPEMRAAWDQATRWTQERKQVIARQYRIAKDEYGPLVMAAVRDAENQRRILEGLGALHSAHLQWKQMRTNAVYKGLKLAGQLQVQTGMGRISIADVARRRMVENFPYLEGTALTEDPAAPLAHLITGDREYFFEEMPLVERSGRKVSLKDAIIQSSALDTDETMKILAVYEAADDVAHTLDTGEGTIDAIGSTLTAIETLGNK